MRYSTYKEGCRRKYIFPLVDENRLTFYRGKNNVTYDTVHKKVKNLLDYKDNDGTYHLYPIGYCTHSYYIVCPYCGEIHIHGKVGGYRTPHCTDSIGLADYYIEEVDINV